MTKERVLYGEIKVRPFISTLALKYISVAIFCLYHISAVLRLELMLNQLDDFKTEEAIIDGFLNVLMYIGNIGLPLVLIWIVSLINGFEDRAFKMVLFYGAVGILFYIGEVLSIKYYLLPKVNEITNNYIGIQLDEDIMLEVVSHFSNFNVFLDMFLCSCIYFFGASKPKRIKTKKGMIIFRSCVILPIAYIIAAFVIDGLLEMAELPFSSNIYIGCLIPNRKPVLFIMFSLVVLFMVFRERIYNYIHRNKSNETTENGEQKPVLSYEEYKKTNRYCINYSLVVSLILSVCAIADTLIGKIEGAKNFGFGDSMSLMLAIPFLLLHDFTAKPLKKYSSLWTGVIYGATGMILVVLYLSMAGQLVNSLKNMFA